MPIRVILLEPETGGNIGSVARSMRNFRLSDFWIVNPKTRINNEAKAFAMKGIDVLNAAKIVPTFRRALKNVDVVVGTSAVSATSVSNLSRVSIKPSELARRIRAVKGDVAIVFGRESSGLSNSEVEACDFMVTIPASRDYNVLNIAAAASIIFYELFRNKTSTGTMEVASKASTVRLVRQFDLVMKRCDVATHRRRLAHRAFRNVISRSFISKREASLILGVIRKAYGKMK